MPPKNRRKSKIKQEPIDDHQIVTQNVDLFKSDQIFQLIKDEKAEKALVIETLPGQQIIFDENLHVKREEAVEYDLKLPEDPNYEDKMKFETAEPSEDSNEANFDEETEKFSKIQIRPSKSPNKALKSSDSRKYLCKICNAGFATKSTLSNHIHTHTDHLKCKKCSKKFKIQKNFESHKCTFECKICHKTFIRNDNLNQHMNYVHGNWKKSELFTCDCCGKGFKYKKSLVCHMKQHMEVKPLVCKICKEGFSVNNTYKQHMLTHGGKVPCKVCGKNLKPSALYYHMRQAHETMRKYQCSTCDATFKTKSDLNNHFATHDKKFQCAICDKKFSKSYKLKIHLKIHENPKIFECKKCFKTLSRKDTLEMHEKWCGEIFHCKKCDFETSNQKRLLRHEAKCIKKEKAGKSTSSIKFRNFGDSESEENEDIKAHCSCDFCGKIYKIKEKLIDHIISDHKELIE